MVVFQVCKNISTIWSLEFYRLIFQIFDEGSIRNPVWIANTPERLSESRKFKVLHI